MEGDIVCKVRLSFNYTFDYLSIILLFFIKRQRNIKIELTKK